MRQNPKNVPPNLIEIFISFFSFNSETFFYSILFSFLNEYLFIRKSFYLNSKKEKLNFRSPPKDVYAITIYFMFLFIVNEHVLLHILKNYYILFLYNNI